jgi:eukaryotic-like serine/threonine-protein kinase
MTPDRWRQIDMLLDLALEQEPSRRASFLVEACNGDEGLRHEVQTLLAAHEQAGSFLAPTGFEAVAKEIVEAQAPNLVGQVIGPYQILSILGKGGMGEVYKARDTRLNRTVAIKVLPRHLSERADLRQRFEREARAIASLDHPHICALHDIGHDQGTDFLVMQYLEGETLSQQLRKGPLPTEEALRYSIEIAGALEQAHRKGVTHRDLKPGNIMLTEAGAKLLDFGLAKQSRPPLPMGTLGNLPTQTESLTEEGMILGTLQYMAPEQVEGQPMDARTDIFALGVVMYEMATGRNAFEGDSKASLIVKILTSQPPPITTLAPVTPPELDAVVQRCLAKNPEERWQSAAELASELKEIAETVLPRLKARRRETDAREAKKMEFQAGPAVPVALPERPGILSRLIRSPAWKLGLVGVLLALIIGTLLVRQLWRQQERRPEIAKEMTVKPLTSSSSSENSIGGAAISPDGKYLAFCSGGKVFLQILQTGVKRPLTLPEGFVVKAITWFPDGTKLLLERSLDYVRVKELGGHSRALSSLWSIPILGGTPQMLIDSGVAGASVSPDGSLIAFTHVTFDPTSAELWLAAANGEQPRKFRAAPWPEVFFAPAWSPDGKRLAYLHGRAVGQGAGYEVQNCDLQGTGISTVYTPKFDVEVIPFSSNPGWTPDGRILFMLTSQFRVEHPQAEISIWESKVDSASGRPLSQPRRLTQWHGFSWIMGYRFSMTADGKKLVLVTERGQADVYMAELQADHSMKNPRRLTLTESDETVGDWTADSRAVLFRSDRSGNGDIFKQDLDQTEPEVVVASEECESFPLLSPEGAWVLYLVAEKPGADKRVCELSTRLMRVPLAGGPPEPVLKGERLTSFSCAREANVCVVNEEVDGKQVLSTFDPLKGRGEKLPFSTDLPPGLTSQLLSPQGRLIEKWKAGPDGLQVRIRSLREGPVQDLVFKKLVKECDFSGWSFDGKGIYLREVREGGGMLYVGLDGHIQPVWKKKSGPEPDFTRLIPSRDGRHIAFSAYLGDSNAWVLENF